MAKTKYYINLTAEERDLLMRIVCEARESERTIYNGPCVKTKKQDIYHEQLLT